MSRLIRFVFEDGSQAYLPADAWHFGLGVMGNGVFREAKYYAPSDRIRLLGPDDTPLKIARIEWTDETEGGRA